MKPALLLLMSAMIMSAHCLSTFHFHHGDQLLRAMQERKGKTFVIMIAKDDTTDKSLAVTNARVADGLYHQVLFKAPEPDKDGKTQGEPTPRDVVWARVNADDENRNSHLLYRLKIDKKSLDSSPIVVVFKDGTGTQMYGPTTVRHTMRKVEELTKPPEGDAKKEEAPKTA